MTISAGRKGATSKSNKVWMSSNDRDSRLCGVVVHTTPPSHDAAATQVDPAAATAPAGRAITSVAAAPAAASNAAVELSLSMMAILSLIMLPMMEGGGHMEMR
jgi:hypothetical protein